MVTKLIQEIVQRHNLYWTDTYYDTGPTWYGSGGKVSHPDHVIVSGGLHEAVTNIVPLRRSNQRLKLIRV